jgi:hypothetical protein
MSTAHWLCSVNGLHEFNATKTTLVARQMFACLSMQVQWILLGLKRAFAGEFVVARKFSKAVSQGSATPLRAWMKIQFLPQTSGRLGGDRLVGLLFSQQVDKRYTGKWI